MPISGPSSYVSTTDEFLANWQNADTALGAGNEIVLQGGTNRAGLTALKDDLVAKRTELQDKLNDKEGARGDVEIQKAALLSRLKQFNEKIRAFFEGTKFVRMLPDLPSQTDAQSGVMDALEDGNSIWQKVNADPGTASPVTLLGGYNQATFAADVATLRTAYTTLNASENNLKFVREQRNDLQDTIREVLVKYRKALPTFFPSDHALVQSLPRLTPLPGSTPQGVTLSGEWNAQPGYAVLTWTASADPNLEGYEVRMTVGPVYDADSDTVIANEPPGVLSHQTVQGLPSPGAMASYKVFVILSTGNESGSNAVTITRPSP